MGGCASHSHMWVCVHAHCARWCFIHQNVIAVKLCDDSGCCLLLISSVCFNLATVEIV